MRGLVAHPLEVPNTQATVNDQVPRHHVLMPVRHDRSILSQHEHPSDVRRMLRDSVQRRKHGITRRRSVVRQTDAGYKTLKVDQPQKLVEWNPC